MLLNLQRYFEIEILHVVYGIIVIRQSGYFCIDKQNGSSHIDYSHRSALQRRYCSREAPPIALSIRQVEYNYNPIELQADLKNIPLYPLL